MIKKIIGFLNNGHERTVRMKKNIVYSVGLRGGSIVLGFFSAPLALTYLTTAQFGILQTLLSIINWFAYFDIGLGKGLRNKFSEALARGEDDHARKLLSTAYFALAAIMTVLFGLFLIANVFLDWHKILNAEPSTATHLSLLAIIVFGTFAIRFVFSLINEVNYAFQRPAVITLQDFLGQLLNFLGIIVLLKTTKGSLLMFGGMRSILFAIIPMAMGAWFYKTKYKKYAPSLKHVRIAYTKDLATLGLKFFLIQVSLVVIGSTNNILISHFVGPELVTAYQLAFRYFSIIVMVFQIICMPLWSAYTEAYAKGDIDWMKSMLKRIKKIWLVLCGVLLVMLAVSGPFYHLWVGDKVQIPFLLSLSVGMLMIVDNWIRIYHTVINGIGKVRLQLILTIIAGLINIPVSILYVKVFHLGAAGIVFGSVTSLLINACIAPIQTKKLIERTAQGIWTQ